MSRYSVAGIEIDQGVRLVEPIFLADDDVELIRDVPGRKVLRAGLCGRVVCGDEADPELGLLSVTFPKLGGRTWQLRRQHLRHAAVETEEAACS